MKIPRSWLTPTVDVQRSALALSTHSDGAVGLTVSWRPVESIGVQSVPVLPTLRDCLVREPSTRLLVVGKRRPVRRVAEYTGPLPAAATMVLLVGLFVFHRSLIVYGCAAANETKVCT